MITPIKFTVDEFISPTSVREYNSISAENLSGSELVDNLILLKFLSLKRVQTVLRDKHNLSFTWCKADPTPADYRGIADKYGVLFENGKAFTVFVPLGATVDEAALALDLPSYNLRFQFIADCNYRMLRYGINGATLSDTLAKFRPLLVLRRLVLECIELTGTDVHFESHFDENKRPMHFVKYRVKRELVPSMFSVDFNVMEKVLQEMVSKLSPISASDLDSKSGVTTSVRDLFGDGSCDLRVNGSRVDAGFYVVIAVQTTFTTTKKVDELGFLATDVEQLRELARKRTGLTLVTGAMRSGKNTTIFAMLNEIVDTPIRIMEYSNPIENHMPFPQFDYHGDLDTLEHMIRMAKKADIDLAVLNEVPDSKIAFAVRDLVNSAVGVITTTHIDRLWHLPYKLQEFFGSDYKTILSQLNAVVNHKMFRRWEVERSQRRPLYREQGDFEKFCYNYGVRQYFVPMVGSSIEYKLQPIIETLVITDSMKSAMLNFDEIWRAEDMLKSHLKQQRGCIEYKLAEYINNGWMSLEEMRSVYTNAG